MLVESLGISLIVGKIRGGRFYNIGTEVIKGWAFIVASFLLQYICIFLARRGYNFIKANILYIHFLSYVLLIIGIILNIKKLPFKIILIGVLLNFLVIFSNDGQMPVSKDALVNVGLLKNIGLIENGSNISHKLIDPKTNLWFLADIFTMGKKPFFPSVFSIGDVFISVGAFIYIQILMLRKSPQEN